ncbi:Nucleoredoxin [Durusdinium trenchii]|uniref:Nucleoredoxin n=1 Tax=Durusdinium trenchii TaxID=1381693 RepID=A0ABP0MVM7_9DINO
MGSGASAPKDMASGAKELLGEHLIKCGGDEKVSVEEALKDKKAVALYFSAHWCPPCRGFTPKLAEAYTSHLKDKGLEVIFVSSDRDDASWKEYCGEMPWLALPREAKGPVASKFKVRGIPTMIILDPTDGSIITEDGRSAVMKDPTGEKFPWKPPTFKEVMGKGEFLKGEGTVGPEAIAGKHLGLYFSAHWCPPCRAFTPQLAKWYAGVKKELGDKFEIVFCSGDRDDESLKEYYKHMKDEGDWCALPFDRKDDLDGIYKIEGIPTFLPPGRAEDQWKADS